MVWEKKIVFVNGVLREVSSFMDLHFFNLIHCNNINFLDYNGLIAAIREGLKINIYFFWQSLHAIYHSKTCSWLNAKKSVDLYKIL